MFIYPSQNKHTTKVIFDTRFKYNDDNCSVFINSANCFELLLRDQL